MRRFCCTFFSHGLADIHHKPWSPVCDSMLAQRWGSRCQSFWYMSLILVISVLHLLVCHARGHFANVFCWMLGVFSSSVPKKGRIVVAVWTLKEIALMRIHGNGDFLWRTAVVGELYDLKSTTQLIYPPPKKAAMELEHRPSFQPCCQKSVITKLLFVNLRNPWKIWRQISSSWAPIFWSFPDKWKRWVVWLLVQEGGSLQSGPRLITPFIGVKEKQVAYL